MSHFTVAVITKDPNNLEDIMAPFFEQGDDDSPYMEFEDCTEEVQDDWAEYCKNAEPNELKAQQAVGSMTYKDIDDYAENYHGYTKNDEGKYGYMTNPNSKWDGFSVGGRWPGMLQLKDGGIGINGSPGLMTEANEDPTKCDVALLKDIDFEGMKNDHIKNVDEIWAKFEKGEYKDPYREAGIEKDETKETFLARRLGAPTFSFLTEEGNWIEPGSMGWFGCSTDTKDTRAAYDEQWHECLKQLDHDDTYLMIVDCHI